MGTSAKFLCPQCSGKLQPGPEGSERLDCQNCPLSYPLRDSMPILVIKQASARKVATDDEQSCVSCDKNIDRLHSYRV